MTLQYATPISGSTVTASAGVDNLVIDPAGSLAALSVVFPPSPSDDDQFTVTSDKTVTTTVLSTSDGSAIRSPSSPGTSFLGYAAGGSHTWVYAVIPNAWFGKA